jgi:DNA-binding MarR family transcriptional regulator
MALREALRANSDAAHTLSLRMGVGHSDLAALDYLSTASGPVGTVELARRLGMRSASATVLVDRLEKAGHLVRHPHPEDRRRIALQVTSSARQDLLTALSPLTTAIDQLATGMQPEHAQAAAQFLRQAAQVFRTFAEIPLR